MAVYAPKALDWTTYDSNPDFLHLMSTGASSSTVASSKKPESSATDLELEKLLSREASEFQRETEVERIFKAFKFKCVYREASSLHIELTACSQSV